jgi:hypothetical protein
LQAKGDRLEHAVGHPGGFTTVFNRHTAENATGADLDMMAAALQGQVGSSIHDYVRCTHLDLIAGPDDLDIPGIKSAVTVDVDRLVATRGTGVVACDLRELVIAHIQVSVTVDSFTAVISHGGGVIIEDQLLQIALRPNVDFLVAFAVFNV